MPKFPIPRAPEHLSRRAATLWKELAAEVRQTPGRLVLFQAALEALDRAEGARRAIYAAGLTHTTQTTGALHAHPLLRVETEARRRFAALWQRLGLTLPPDPFGLE